MLEYNEITTRKYIVIDDEPYEVLASHVFRKQQRKPVNQTKLRNLISGKVTEIAFHQSEKAEEADIESQPIKFLYSSKNEHWFCEKDDQSKRFTLKEDTLGSQIKFIKANSIVDALIFDEKIIGVKIPIKVDLKVTDAPPAVKGNTAQGGTKVITVETGATLNAPMFINPNDIVRVNTETGEYVERVTQN